MKKQKREYLEEFKEQAINLLRTTDRSASEIERELGITQGLLSRWNRKRAAAEGTPIAPRAKRPLQGCPADAATWPQRQTAAVLQGNDETERRPSGGTELSTAGLYGDAASIEMVRRYHLHLDHRRLVVPGSDY